MLNKRTKIVIQSKCAYNRRYQLDWTKMLVFGFRLPRFIRGFFNFPGHVLEVRTEPHQPGILVLSGAEGLQVRKRFLC